jgi:hypothetical protein
MKKTTQTIWFLNMKNKKDAIINAVLLVAIVIVYVYIANIIFDFVSPEAPSNTQEKFVDSSLWFDASTENYLSFTPSTDGTSNYIFTVSFWVKRGSFADSYQPLWDIDETTIVFNNDKLHGNLRGTGWGNYSWTTKVVFRDPSAWYHIVAAWDSTQSIDTNRFKLYVNGRIQKFSSISYMPQHREMKDTQTHYIGQASDNYYFDGYLADYYMIDGQQLTPSSFGDGEKGDYGGIWKPIEYDGTFGTNGFYLDFDGSELGSKKIIDSSPNQHSITVHANGC